MNVDKIEKLGIGPLKKLVESTIGEWPLLKITKANLKEKFDEDILLKVMTQTATSPFVDFSTYADANKTTENRLYVSSFEV